MTTTPTTTLERIAQRPATRPRMRIAQAHRAQATASQRIARRQPVPYIPRDVFWRNNGVLWIDESLVDPAGQGQLTTPDVLAAHLTTPEARVAHLAIVDCESRPWNNVDSDPALIHIGRMIRAALPGAVVALYGPQIELNGGEWSSYWADFDAMLQAAFDRRRAYAAYHAIVCSDYRGYKLTDATRAQDEAFLDKTMRLCKQCTAWANDGNGGGPLIFNYWHRAESPAPPQGDGPRRLTLDEINYDIGFARDFGADIVSLWASTLDAEIWWSQQPEFPADEVPAGLSMETWGAYTTAWAHAAVNNAFFNLNHALPEAPAL